MRETIDSLVCEVILPGLAFAIVIGVGMACIAAPLLILCNNYRC